MVKAGNKATLIIEYAIVIGIVAAALAVIQVYMRRGIQGVIKTSADQILGIPSEEYFKRNNIVTDLNSQWLGAWERGLVSSTNIGGGPVVTTSSSATNITLTETPSSDPIMTRTINRDTTSTSTNSQTVTAPPQLY